VQDEEEAGTGGETQKKDHIKGEFLVYCPGKIKKKKGVTPPQT